MNVGCLTTTVPLLAMVLVVGLALSLASAEGAPTVDGTISLGEYSANATFGDGVFLLHWSLMGEDVFLAIQARTEGAVILSISPDHGMHQGDNLVAWVGEDNETNVLDCFCLDEGSVPVLDVDRGGTSDILEMDGSRADGTMVVELRRASETFDAFDRTFPERGSIYVTWATTDNHGIGGEVLESGTEILSIDGNPYPPAIEPSDAVDGVVEEGEYANMASFGDGHYVLHWEVDGDAALFGIVAETRGWVALGIEPTRRMLDSDMYFGWYSDVGGPGALDAYSVGDFGPHPPDITLGGTSDILEYNAREVGGVTTLEFKRLLATGDDRDNALPSEGAVTIVWATAVSDVYSVKHDIKGMGSILMEGGAPPPPGYEEGIDGIVEEGEYEFSASFAGGDYRLHWRVQGDDLRLAVRARTTGWVALGIDPNDRMEGADMIIGWVEAGEPIVHDAYATGPTGPHPPDVGLGGTYDIISYNASEEGGWTTVELIRPLVTGDDRDKDIPIDGSLVIIWAMGDSDGFDDVHSERGTGIIEIKRGTSEEVTTNPIYTYHMALMALGVLLAFATYLPLRMKERLPHGRWFRLHRTLGPAAAMAAIVGVAAAVAMVSELDDGHLRALHPYGGVLAIIINVGALVLGLAFLRWRKAKQSIRRPHVVMGYLAISLLVLASLSGLLRLLELGWL